MANYLRFKCTFSGEGKYGVAGQSYSPGEEFTMTSEEARTKLKEADFISGNIMLLGEVRVDDGDWSDSASDFYDGKRRLDNNILPTNCIDLTDATIVLANGSNASAGVSLDRRVAVSKILARKISHGLDPRKPRILVTAGNFNKINPHILYYNASLKTYGSLTNGSIAANNPDAEPWADGDIIFVGADRRCASLNIDWDQIVGSVSSGSGKIKSIKYWDGSALKSFDSFKDYTAFDAGSFSRETIEDSTSRIVWWSKPGSWRPGLPGMSGSDKYYVALILDGPLTGLDGMYIHLVDDKPLADVDLSEYRLPASFVATSIGGIWSDITNDMVDSGSTSPLSLSGATDHIYVAYTQPFGGCRFEMGTSNTLASASFAQYWNGVRWSSQASIATDKWAGQYDDITMNPASATLNIDGDIYWRESPIDWLPAVASEVAGLASSGLALPSEELFWVRFGVSSNLSGTTSLSTLHVQQIGRRYFPFPSIANSFVEAEEAINAIFIDSDPLASFELQAVISDI